MRKRTHTLVDIPTRILNIETGERNESRYHCEGDTRIHTLAIYISVDADTNTSTLSVSTSFEHTP